jgi:Flp pilus assembly protein TadG
MKHSKEKGSVLLEMTVMMPVMILLTLVSIQFSLLINAYISVKNVSGVVAKYAILTDPKPSEQEVLTFASTLISQTLDVANLVTPTLEPVLVGSQESTKVTLQYNAPIIVPLPGRSGQSSFPIKVSTVMW